MVSGQKKSFNKFFVFFILLYILDSGIVKRCVGSDIKRYDMRDLGVVMDLRRKNKDILVLLVDKVFEMMFNWKY